MKFTLLTLLLFNLSVSFADTVICRDTSTPDNSVYQRNFIKYEFDVIQANSEQLDFSKITLFGKNLIHGDESVIKVQIKQILRQTRGNKTFVQVEGGEEFVINDLGNSLMKEITFFERSTYAPFGIVHKKQKLECAKNSNDLLALKYFKPERI